MESMASAKRWQDESTATKCSCLTPYSSICWKHHCRVCGAIFCDSCSSYYLPLREIPESEVCPYPVVTHWLTDPMRCCLQCKRRIKELFPNYGCKGQESKSVSDRV